MFYKTSDNYNKGVVLNFYRGEYKIAAAWVGEKGDEKMEWVYPQKDRKPIDSTIPLAVNLGEKERALNTLRSLMREIQGDTPQVTPQVEVSENEIPF